MVNITASRTRIGVFALGTIGMIALTGGSLLLGFYQTITRYFIERELVLEPGHDFFDIWKGLPLPLYQKVYLFNITNPKAFAFHGSKPILQELGPYVYSGKWKKENMEWDDENGTVTYKDSKSFTFVPELSNGTLEDKIYTLNGPLLGVINQVEELAPFFFRSLIIQILNSLFESYNETLLVHKSVRELLYEGYHEPMVEDLTAMVEPFFDLPLKLINDTFGILFERQIIGDGVFTVNSGKQGIENYAGITKWNNMSSVNWWNDQYCDQINGTDGAQFTPGVKRTEQLYFFNPNLCRSLRLIYDRDITVHGIPTYRFSLPSDVMSSPEINPDNSCYCSNYKCHFSGVLPYNCRKGAPYVLSHPHFFEADPELQKSLDGIKPSADKHKTIFDVEPITGLVLNAAVKLQLNGVIRKQDEYETLRNVTDSIIPVLWLSEEATLDTFFANFYKTKAQIPLTVFKALCITSVALGVLWTVSAIFFIFCFKGKVKPLKVKNSLVLNTLQSVYTGVALWPPAEEDAKEVSQFLKTNL